MSIDVLEAALFDAVDTSEGKAARYDWCTDQY